MIKPAQLELMKKELEKMDVTAKVLAGKVKMYMNRAEYHGEKTKLDDFHRDVTAEIGRLKESAEALEYTYWKAKGGWK